MAQWLERGALSMSLPVVRFRIQFRAEFSEKYHASPLSILGTLSRCCVLGQGTSPSNASLRVPGRTEMAAGLYALSGVEMAHK